MPPSGAGGVKTTQLATLASGMQEQLRQQWVWVGEIPHKRCGWNLVLGYEGLGLGYEDLELGHQDLGLGYEDVESGYEDLGLGYEVFERI